MSDEASGRRGEMRTPPTDPGLVAQAAANPGGWVYAIDGEMVGGDPDGYVPPEALQGGWAVGPDGKLTGDYDENPQYGTPTDDFTKLLEAIDGVWSSLLTDPVAMVRESMAELLGDQVDGAVLEWMKVTDKPETVTGAKRDPDNEQYVTVVRSGLAVPFALSVRTPDGRREILWGVYTLAMADLDKPGQWRSRVWLDLRASLEWATEQLSKRVYEVGQS